MVGLSVVPNVELSMILSMNTGHIIGANGAISA